MSKERTIDLIISTKKLAQFVFYAYFCIVKTRKGLIVLLGTALVCLLLIIRNAPIVVGGWTKQTIYLWLLNSLHIQKKDASPRILLIDDDSGKGIFALKKICNDLHIKAIYAIIPNKMNQTMIDSIRDWQKKGFGITLHGYKHNDWRNWTYEQVVTDIEKCEKWLQQNRFDNKAIKYVVSPHGSNTKAVRDAIKHKGYQMVTGANILNPDTEVFQLGRVMITKDTDLEETKVWLKKAKERKLFVILGTHSSIPDEFSEEKTRAILSMAKDIGFEFDH